MKCFSKRTEERIDKLRWGKTWTKKAAFLQHRPYLPGQPIATNSRCPLPGCQGNDGAGHILLECTHADLKKQHIARHDAMMRMLIKGFTKGTKGSHYLTADVGTADTLKDIGVHSKRVPEFVLPDSHIQHMTQDLQPCRNNLTCQPPCPMAEQGASLLWKEATVVTSRIWRRSGEKGQQHAKLEEALRLYGYSLNASPP